MPLDLLEAFAKKRVRKDEVLRAMCEYPRWFAPLSVAHPAMGNQTFESLAVWGAQSKVPAGTLYLFTDNEAGQRAFKTQPLGPYAAPIAGARLFRHLPDGLKEVHVNPGSRPEHSWFMGGDWVKLARRWGAAVALERLLGGKEKGELVAELIDFAAFTVLQTPKHTLATRAAGKLKHAAMVFTAPDCADAAVSASGAAGKKLRRVVKTGKQLFNAFPKLGVDGFVFNPFGPGPQKVFDEPLCWGVLSAIAGRQSA